MPCRIISGIAGTGIPPEADLRLFQNRYKSILCQQDAYLLESEGISFEHVVNRVAGVLDLTPAQVLAGGKHKETVAARSLLCFRAATESAISQVELAQKLKISQPAVSMAVRRGEQLASHNSYRYSLKD